MTIDANDPGTLDLDLGTLDLDLGDLDSAATVTVEGWGTGTTAELAHAIAQLRAERDSEAARAARAEAQLGDPDAVDGRELVAIVARIAERAAEAWFDGPGADAIERIAHQAAEEGFHDLAYDVVRDVIRNEVTISLDLI